MQTNEIYNSEVVADATAAAAASRETSWPVFASAMSADSMWCQNIQGTLLVNEVGLVGPGTDTIPPDIVPVSPPSTPSTPPSAPVTSSKSPKMRSMRQSRPPKSPCTRNRARIYRRCVQRNTRAPENGTTRGRQPDRDGQVHLIVMATYSIGFAGPAMFREL